MRINRTNLLLFRLIAAISDPAEALFRLMRILFRVTRVLFLFQVTRSAIQLASQLLALRVTRGATSKRLFTSWPHDVLLQLYESAQNWKGHVLNKQSSNFQTNAVQGWHLMRIWIIQKLDGCVYGNRSSFWLVMEERSENSFVIRAL